MAANRIAWLAAGKLAVIRVARACKCWTRLRDCFADRFNSGRPQSGLPLQSPRQTLSGLKPRRSRCARIAVSNCWRWNGNRTGSRQRAKQRGADHAAVRIRHAAKSRWMKTLAASPPALRKASASARPSPMAIFSVIEYTRLVEAIKVVRSGVTRPRVMARARFHQL